MEKINVNNVIINARLVLEIKLMNVKVVMNKKIEFMTHHKINVYVKIRIIIILILFI